MKRRRKFFGFTLFSVIWVFALFLVLCFAAGTKLVFGGEVVEKQMIGGKEYRVEKIENEPGKYMVFWGDDQYKWEPLPYMPDYLLKEGPLFYNRWTKPGLQHPWKENLDERLKFDGDAVYLRCLDHIGWMSPRDYAHVARYPYTLLDAKGRERVKISTEYLHPYYTDIAKSKIPKELQGVLARKYLMVMSEPDDVKGVGVLSYDYRIRGKSSDIWFYTPSVRKVRRMSEGSRQDFVIGSVYRNEDSAIVGLFHHYKIVKTQLFHPPLDYLGYPNCKFKYWADNDPKRYHGEGQPCWVIEETPGKTPWWFAKQIRYVGIKDFSFLLSEAYDEKGRMIRYLCHGDYLFDPVNYPLFANWQGWNVHDLNTGFMTYGPVDFGKRKGYGDSVFMYLDEKNGIMPEEGFSPETLLKEPVKLQFWR